MVEKGEILAKEGTDERTIILSRNRTRKKLTIRQR